LNSNFQPAATKNCLEQSAAVGELHTRPQGVVNHRMADLVLEGSIAEGSIAEG